MDSVKYLLYGALGLTVSGAIIPSTLLLAYCPPLSSGQAMTTSFGVSFFFLSTLTI